MFPRSRRPRALVSAAILVVVAALSVAVPLLDRGRDPGALAVSEPGHPAGYVEHNHSICLQHGATAWLPTVGDDLPYERWVDRTATPGPTTVDPTGPTACIHHSRAPPRA